MALVVSKKDKSLYFYFKTLGIYYLTSLVWVTDSIKNVEKSFLFCVFLSLYFIHVIRQYCAPCKRP